MTSYLLTLHRPDVQCLLIAYTVDLIYVLKEFFDFTLKPDSALIATWEVLNEAFKAHELINASTISFVKKRRWVNKF